jgi:peptide/nickel transport system substrate-binding protein
MLRRWLALLAVLGLATSLLGAASAHPSKYGGTLVVGVNSGDPNTLDPVFNNTPAASEPIFAVMCQRLYAWNARLRLVPLLAAALPALSADKLTYTITLRQGILFNDGTPFNAAAVLSAIQREMAAGSLRRSEYASVASVTATGPYTLVYRLKSRNSTFIGGNPYVTSPTAVATEGDGFASHPVCVGPFMFDHWVPGDNVTVIKSQYYYDKGDIHLDKIVFKPMPVAPAAAAALKAGDIQVMNQVSTTEIDGVRSVSSLRVIQAYQLGWTGVQFNIGNRSGVLSLPYSNVGTPFASNAKLRQAFEEAIDRNALNRVVYGGDMQVICDMIPPADTVWFATTQVPCTPYDPVDARKLVAASGIPNPTLHLLTGNTSDALLRAQFIQAEEAAVGINVVLDPVDTTTNAARRLSGNFDAYLGGFTPGGVDPTEVIHLATWDDRNYAGYSNPRLDLILANGLKAASSKARSTLYRVAQQIILADRPYISLYNPIVYVGFSANVTGISLTANGVINVAYAQFK